MTTDTPSTSQPETELAPIVVFGATGYTGRLTVAALVELGVRPLIAGRNAEKLAALSGRHGGLETRVADVSNPASVRALVEPGSVLVSTVGPFARFGQAALDAALDAGAHYLDSTGEPAFIARVFQEARSRAEDLGCTFLTAFGYDFVPGNLAAGLALREAGSAASRVDVGYFAYGRGGGMGMSQGTAASLVGALIEPGVFFRGGRHVTRPGGLSSAKLLSRGKRRPALEIPASEHFGLPPVYPHLERVNTYLGWFGPATVPLVGLSHAQRGLGLVPGYKALVRKLAARMSSQGEGPGAEDRSTLHSAVCATAYDHSGAELAHVELTGPNGYTYTAAIIAWGAHAVAAGRARGVGTVGPIEAFGLETLEEGNASVGMSR